MSFYVGGSGGEWAADAVEHFADWRRRRRLTRRDRRARAAAAEAAQDDPAFAADEVLKRARAVAKEFRAAVLADDEHAVRECTTAVYGEHVLAEIRRNAGPAPISQRVEELRLFLVGITNLQDDEHDRVVVGAVGASPGQPWTALIWQMARGEEGWIFAAIEPYHTGRRQLDEPLVASPWHADDVADRTTLQLAGDQPAVVALGELTDGDAEGLVALRDLALVDARWSPHVLAAAARRVIDAWEHAAIQGPTAFAGVATDQAARALVHPRGGSSRVEVRGLVVERIEVDELLPDREPPAVRLVLELRGRHALLNVGGVEARVGSLRRDRDVEERWLFELVAEPDRPWHLAEADPLGWRWRNRRTAARRRRAAGQT
jgi:hypothetical protein